MAATNIKGGLQIDGASAISSPTALVARIAGGSATVTDATLDVVTGLSAVVACWATLGEDPGAGAGDVFQVSAVLHATAGTITLSIWQDDATAATEDTSVFWGAIGT